MKKEAKSYIFLDESGKPEIYSRKGTNLVEARLASRYLAIVAIRTMDHLALQQAVTEKRLELLHDPALSVKFSPAYSLDAFHAQTDYPEVKRKVYEWIRDCSLELKITAIVAEKAKAYAALQRDPARLYATVAGQLLKRFLHTAEDIEVVFSRRDASLKARERLQLVVDAIRFDFADSHGAVPRTRVVYHHSPHYTHGGLQIADYVAHAIFQVFESGRREWFDIIKDRIGYIQDIFNQKSYTRSNPL